MALSARSTTCTTMSSNVGGLRPTRCIPQVTEFLAGYPSPSSFSYYSRSDVCALQCFPPSAVPSSLPLQSSIDAKYIHSRLSSLRHSSVPIASKKPSGAVDKVSISKQVSISRRKISPKSPRTYKTPVWTPNLEPHISKQYPIRLTKSLA